MVYAGLHAPFTRHIQNLYDRESVRLAKVGPHWVKESLTQWLVFFYKEGWREM